MEDSAQRAIYSILSILCIFLPVFLHPLGNTKQQNDKAGDVLTQISVYITYKNLAVCKILEAIAAEKRGRNADKVRLFYDMHCLINFHHLFSAHEQTRLESYNPMFIDQISAYGMHKNLTVRKIMEVMHTAYAIFVCRFLVHLRMVYASPQKLVRPLIDDGSVWVDETLILNISNPTPPLSMVQYR